MIHLARLVLMTVFMVAVGACATAKPIEVAKAASDGMRVAPVRHCSDTYLQNRYTRMMSLSQNDDVVLADCFKEASEVFRNAVNVVKHSHKWDLVEPLETAAGASILAATRVGYGGSIRKGGPFELLITPLTFEMYWLAEAQACTL
ncbi:hypothetical protein FJZ23_02060 [Candidatus Parcubacteria bacterium]|nr:hypothetical protein [Candidatus Parcubacteria bacterium]